MLVTRDDLERRLAELRLLVRDPEAGIYGPGSHAWELKRESINFLGGARAALLQLAHPFVAHAIDQHSATREDIQGRFQRTFINVFAMTFGDLDRAFKSARGVHNVHARIHGQITEDVGRYRRGAGYHANESSALTWVWATLIDTILQVHQRFVRPLSPAFVERFYQESKRFAMLFGIPDDDLPATHEEFERYVRQMVETDALAVGGPALEMSRFLLASPSAGLRPLFGWGKVMTAGLMPARLRRQFELPWGRRERALFSASARAVELAYRATPRNVRYLPSYVESRKRLAGQKPSRLDGLTYIALHRVTERMAG